MIRRGLLVALAMTGCSDKREPVPSAAAPASSPASAPAPAPRVPPPTLPANFPARGAPAATGNLVGAPFAIAKAHLRLDPQYAVLDFYSWTDRAACEPQFAPDAKQLYVSVQLPAARAATGAAIDHDDTGVMVTYKKPTLHYVEGVKTTVVFDAVDDHHARGRLLLDSPDGSHVAGSFDASCARARRRPPRRRPSSPASRGATAPCSCPRCRSR